MIDNLLHLPDVRNRKRETPLVLHRGSVVAFRYGKDQRTGVIVMEDRTMMLAAYNLYDEGETWTMDILPSDIELFEANDEEKQWGYGFLLDYYYEFPNRKDEQIYAFIEKECPQTDKDDIKMSFCRDAIRYVPKMIDRSQWVDIKSTVTEKLKQVGGLQFNQYQAELYCLLMSVLMVAEQSKDEECRLARTQLLYKNWTQFSWMYGIGIGRVIGSELHNFSSVVNQIGLNYRQYYIHLYLPLVESYFDKIIKYNDDKPENLRKAINKVKKTEEMVEQRTDLDELYGILFPKYFQDIMSSSRPANTFAILKQEMEAKDRRIKELENAVDDLPNRYNQVLDQLTTAVSDVESDKITADDLTAAFMRLPAELAFSFFGSMSTLLAQNSTWQKYSPKINEKILAKLNEKEQKQAKMMELANKPTTQNIHLEVVQKKETNIDKNYGPNIEQNGGTLSLPGTKVAEQ